MLEHPPTIGEKTDIGFDWEEMWSRADFTVDSATMTLRENGEETAILEDVACSVDGSKTYYLVDFAALDDEDEPLYVADTVYKYTVTATITVDGTEHVLIQSETFRLQAV